MNREFADYAAEESGGRVVLALSEAAHLASWVKFAEGLAGESASIILRGLITVPADRSLSEGATPARQMREAFDAISSEAVQHDANEISVDFRPLAHILDSFRADSGHAPIDLLIVQWAGPRAPTGGLNTNEILRYAPSDVVLVCGDAPWDAGGPVLLSLRGGPNLTLGVRVAKAVARDASITLFHAARSTKVPPGMSALMRAEPSIVRSVTAVSDIADGIIHEAHGHKAIIMGAAIAEGASGDASDAATVVATIAERTETPLILIRARSQEEVTFHSPRPRLGRAGTLSTRVDRWFAENTFHSYEFSDLRALLALKEKQGVTISVGLPALNEEATVGLVIDTIKRALMDEVPLIDEIVLIDSNSTDATMRIAADCGIPTYQHPEILPEMGSYRGKGEALWKSLHVLKGDLIAWIDTDITNIHPRFIYGLIGPLLRRPQVQYVKGYYQRPIKVGDQMQTSGGGRVTELVARPLLNLFYPELSGIIQPLSGEYAGRRTALEAVPFFSGYGVETGLLIDLHEQFGLDGIAQVDLEERVHHNQPLVGLSKMSFAILQVFIARIEHRFGIPLLDKANHSMKLITQTPERFALDIAEISDIERPPMVTIPAYSAARRR